MTLIRDEKTDKESNDEEQKDARSDSEEERI